MAKRVFDYRDDGSLAIWAALSATVAVVSILGAFWIALSAADVRGAAAVGVTLGLLGTWAGGRAAKLAFRFWRERIEIEDGVLRWVDWRGVTVVESRLSEVVPGSFLGGTQESFVSNESAWSVGAGKGTLRFTSGIRHFNELVARLRPFAGPAAPTGTLDYRRSALLLPAALVLPALLLGVVMIWQAAVGQSRMSVLSTVAFCAAGGAFIAAQISILLSYLNERIVLDDNRIRWYDRYGRLRLDVSRDEVIYGSVERGPLSNGAQTFVVRTQRGPLKFSSRLKNAQSLVEMFERMPMGPGAARLGPWVNDPRHEQTRA